VYVVRGNEAGARPERRRGSGPGGVGPLPLHKDTLRDEGASPHRPKGLEKGRKSTGTARRLGVAGHDEARGPTAPARWTMPGRRRDTFAGYYRKDSPGPVAGGVGHGTGPPKRREGDPAKDTLHPNFLEHPFHVLRSIGPGEVPIGARRGVGAPVWGDAEAEADGEAPGEADGLPVAGAVGSEVVVRSVPSVASSAPVRSVLAAGSGAGSGRPLGDTVRSSRNA
jgi:hypothetical protein